MTEIFCLYWHRTAEDVEVTEESPLWLTGRAKRLDQVGKGRQAKSRFVNLPMGAKELAKTARYSNTVVVNGAFTCLEIEMCF